MEANSSGVRKASSATTPALMGADSGTAAPDVPDDDALALGSHGIDNIRGGQAQRLQFFRVRPDAHGCLRTEKLHAPDAFHTLQFRDNAGGSPFPSSVSFRLPVEEREIIA